MSYNIPYLTRFSLFSPLGIPFLFLLVACFTQAFFTKWHNKCNHTNLIFKKVCIIKSRTAPNNPILFRFTQAGSEVSALLGRIPSAVGYQPTLATDMGSMQERITTTTKGSITSVQVWIKTFYVTQLSLKKN